MPKVPYTPFLHIHPGLKRDMLLEFERFYDAQDYILGAGLAIFEKEYAAFNRVKHAIGVGNGHDAIFIALKTLGIGQSDEVILPAHTFIATALAVQNAGARPVLADIHPDTLTIDPLDVERKINNRTRAIIPVHLYGNPCDMTEMMMLAKNYQIPIIEDNAQAHGAEVNGRKTGSIGIINATSFYPTKNLGALGDGGMITTDNDELAAKARAWRNYGKTTHYSEPGINSRLDEFQAAMLSVKLRHLTRWNSERMHIAEMYEERLQGVGDIRFQQTLPGAVNMRHIFPVISSKREDMKKYLAEKEIETLIHYEMPIHLQPSFSWLGYKKGDFPIAEYVCTSELSLPIYPGLGVAEINYVCESIRRFFRKPLAVSAH
jgi:dTDP-4-amino-4,6-dideoxygalactose transaminase